MLPATGLQHPRCRVQHHCRGRVNVSLGDLRGAAEPAVRLAELTRPGRPEGERREPGCEYRPIAQAITVGQRYGLMPPFARTCERDMTCRECLVSATGNLQVRSADRLGKLCSLIAVLPAAGLPRCALSTGMITPSDVAQRMIPTSSGVWTTPAPLRTNPDSTAMPNEIANPSAVSRRTCPRSLPNSISMPARKSRNDKPIVAITATVWSLCAQPSTAGPTMIPATISSTGDGSRTDGNRPSTNGAANAIATTTSRLSNDGVTATRSPRRG